MLKIENLSFSYSDNKKILNNINLEIKKASFVSIIGHNGSGKSTLAKIISGILDAKDGIIYLDNLKISAENKKKQRKKVGLLFQNPDNQFVGSNVKYDISFGLENECLKKDVILKKVLENAKKVGVYNLLDKSPEELSGGQKQRVAIAGLLALNKDLFIFDEATSMLDKKGRDEIFKLIKKINTEDKKTVIMITHDLDLAIKSDRIIVLKKGEILADIAPSEIIKKSDILKESKIDLPIPLRLINDLENIKNKDEIDKILWEYALKI